MFGGRNLCKGANNIARVVCWLQSVFKQRLSSSRYMLSADTREVVRRFYCGQHEEHLITGTTGVQHCSSDLLSPRI